MNCVHAKKWIYLFDELSEKERAKLMIHVDSCEACHRLQQQAEHDKRILRQALSVKREPPNEARLTSNIMTAIHGNRQRGSALDIFITQTIRPEWQVGFAIVSLFLAGFFVYEYQASGIENRSLLSAASHKSASLDSKRFLGEIKKGMTAEKKGSLLTWYECIHACKDGRTKDCMTCKIKFTKHTKENENM